MLMTEKDLEKWGEKIIPDRLVIDISDALRSLVCYIEKEYNKKYLSVNEFVDSILAAVCVENPFDSLNSHLDLLHDTLIEEDFDPGDVFDILNEAEILGSIIIKEFEMLGFYSLNDFWGYRIQYWADPSTVVLGFKLYAEIDSIPYPKVYDSKEEADAA